MKGDADIHSGSGINWVGPESRIIVVLFVKIKME